MEEGVVGTEACLEYTEHASYIRVREGEIPPPSRRPPLPPGALPNEIDRGMPLFTRDCGGDLSHSGGQ